MSGLIVCAHTQLHSHDPVPPSLLPLPPPLPSLLQHPLSSAYLTLVNQKFPEDHVEQLQVQVDAIAQL